MSYTLNIDPKVFQDIDKHIKSGDKKLAAKVVAFFDELKEHPRSGTGKPERLRGFAPEREMWSRRIDSKNRLIYQIKEQELIVVAVTAYGHYGDK